MGARYHALGPAALLLAVLGFAVHPAEGQVRFQGRVDLVQLNVSVADGRGHVAGLTESDFAIYEDGIPQGLAFFSADPAPIDVGVVLDASSSMRSRMTPVTTATTDFIRALDGRDRAAVFAFNARVRQLFGFTDGRAAIEQVLRGSRATGGTALYDAVSSALQHLRDRGEQAGRHPGLVVISDDEDTSSVTTYQDLRALARRAGVGIYAIQIGSNPAQSRRRSDGFATASIEALARDTGGQSFKCLDVAQLPGILHTIAGDLRLQYTLAFSSSNPRLDGAFHRLAVRVVTRPEVVSRTRIGYVADPR